jgi:mono/diheme cytochrome c family protein
MAPPHYGGWAVITVDDLPDYAVAGKPMTLSFVVRQHGYTRLPDLKGSVEAKLDGAPSVSVRAVAGKEAGDYHADLTLPKAGDWTITINSGFMESKTTLLPIRAIDQRDRAPATIASAERGKQLYIAKGCVTCHNQIKVGPDLSVKRFDAKYLALFLADPTKTVVVAGSNQRMPNLDLKQPEISALVAYVNQGVYVSERR